MSDEKRKARRLFVRNHHPDLGGDVDAFREGLRTFEPAPVEPAPPAAPGAPAGPPVTDRLAKGLGRFVAKTAAVPGEVKDAYRDGRHTDNPL